MWLERVKKALSRRISILIDPGNPGKVRRFAASRWLCTTISLLVISLAVGAGAYGLESALFRNKLSRLERANQEILRRFAGLEKSADSLTTLLAYVQRHDIQLRIQKGMEVLPPDVRKLGIGGPAVGSPEMVELLQMRSPYYEKASQLTRTIDELQRKTQYQQESFAEIDRKLKKDDYIRDHTPSIAPAAGYLTSGFGYRIDPFLHCPKMHPGVDIANSSGTPIVATADGTVTFAGFISGYGRMIKIDHGNQIETRYGHLSVIYIKPGQQVLRGDVIGGMGNTGRSTGTHLHYEVRIAGKAVNPINYFLRKENSRQIGF